MMDYRQPSMCATCPFMETGAGRELRDSLQPGRFEGIKADLEQEKTFPCHETQSARRKADRLLCWRGSPKDPAFKGVFK